MHLRARVPCFVVVPILERRLGGPRTVLFALSASGTCLALLVVAPILAVAGSLFVLRGFFTNLSWPFHSASGSAACSRTAPPRARPQLVLSALMALPEKETRLDEAALAMLLAAGGWRRDGDEITRTFTFKGFKGAVAFANRVAEAANTMNHHPDIHVERYRTVRIVLTTHATGGITDADIELARRIDELETSST